MLFKVFIKKPLENFLTCRIVLTNLKTRMVVKFLENAR